METNFPASGRIDGRRRNNPAESTNKEAEYIEWLSRNKVPVVVKLLDDEELRGWIEYYDRDIIRLTRDRNSNLFVYKERVKYLFEDPAHAPRRR
jgi:sRNA-binding regulator protein Hfq